MAERYRAGERPAIIVKGFAPPRDGITDPDFYRFELTAINSRTAYFRGPYFVGEMAVDADQIEYLDPAPYVVVGNGWEQRIAHPDDNESKHTPRFEPRTREALAAANIITPKEGSNLS